MGCPHPPRVDPLALACWCATPAIVVTGVRLRKGLSVPQALAAYAVGPLCGLVAAGLWFAIWKVALHERDLLGAQSVNRLVPWALGGLVAYVAPFVGVVFRRGRALVMGVVAVVAPVVVLLTVNIALRKGLAAGSQVEPLWLCVFVVIPTAFCLSPGVARSEPGPT